MIWFSLDKRMKFEICHSSRYVACIFIICHLFVTLPYLDLLFKIAQHTNTHMAAVGVCSIMHLSKHFPLLSLCCWTNRQNHTRLDRLPNIQKHTRTFLSHSLSLISFALSWLRAASVALSFLRPSLSRRLVSSWTTKKTSERIQDNFADSVPV